jgi:L-Ala-D/L-Glu epimerase
VANREVAISFWRSELKAPFKVTGHTFTEIVLLTVSIRERGAIGHGEACGVRYRRETFESLAVQARSVQPALERGATRDEIQRLLPAGGARNAIDCALWDLEAKLADQSIWSLTKLQPNEVRTAISIGVDTPQRMAERAAELDTNVIKIKLDHVDPIPRVAAIRAARPDADILVDANQAWTFAELVQVAPSLARHGVKLLEQPLKKGADEALEGYPSPIPLCADESCQDSDDLDWLAKRYQVVNIKLDKTGGLTEALRLARAARARGLELMVGCMAGTTSLGLAPAYVVAQLCRYADLDSAQFLKRDRTQSMSVHQGIICPPLPSLWG